MSRFVLGNCIDVMARIPDNAIDFILTDPPYLVGFRDRFGRTIAGDKTDEWLQPACNEMYRVLKKDALMVSFYGWNRVDRFMAAWKNAGFGVVGHLVFTKNYTSKAAYVGYRHECAYILAKGRPALPQKPLPDVLGWKYSGNRHHPTEKPVIRPRSRQWWQLFRMVSQWHVDVVIVERRSFSIVAAVELDDASHLRPERRRRDILLEEVLRQAGIPLLRSHDARKLLQMTGEWLNTTGAAQQSPEHRS
ncbi:TPA: DNA methyltransferase [Escherichia coli]